MITITIFGYDALACEKLSKDTTKDICKEYKITENELLFIGVNSFICHNGQEQTSYRLDVEISAPKSFKNKVLENDVINILLPYLKEISIHQRFVFTYFDENNEYNFIDDDYPLFLTQDNMVKAESEEESVDNDITDDEEEYNEPYMEDIISQFDDYIRKHPNASNEEVYKALTCIRDDISSKNKK